jgi:hypothetical protein
MTMAYAVTKGIMTAAAAMLLVGCTGSRDPFGNPFASQPRPQPPVAAAPAPAPAPQAANARPSAQIAATPKRVQDTIIARAQRRGTTIVGANNTGVTLQAPLASSSEIVVQQCGPHQEGRVQRIYLETLPDGQNTIVSEDRFIVDRDRSCQLQLTPGDVENGNRALADLKRESEQRRTASNSGLNTRARPADPDGGVEAVDPRRPVRPLQ